MLALVYPPAQGARWARTAVIDVITPGADDLLVELGAGTGEIRPVPSPVCSILGHRPIVEDARCLPRKARGGRRSSCHALLHADADKPWPLGDGAAAVVFASRSAHLLDSEHLVSELLRVCRPGGHFLVGRVIRDQDGLKSRLRRQRKLLLGQLGLTTEDADRFTEGVLDRLVAAGAARIETRPVTKWVATGSAQQILDEWEAVGAAGGRHIDAGSRALVMAELGTWAARELGDAHNVSTWTEHYVLGGVRTSTTRC